MERFIVPAELRKLNTQYPDAKLLNVVAKNGGHFAKQAIARQWLSEGIPFAFKEYPGLYETIRVWLAGRLTVDPKEISLTGSAKIGQSLSPQKIGKPFGHNSDLDLFVVSENLFNQIVKDFSQWSYDFEGAKVNPSNEREAFYWRDNLSRGPKNISKGFIDSKLIPNHKAYGTVLNISQSMYLLSEKLKITDGAPIVKGASVRCYKNWGSCVNQISISL